MKIEIELNREKLINAGYDPTEIYAAIDYDFKNYGLTKEDTGIYTMTGNTAYAICIVAISELTDQEWLLPYYDKWLWYVENRVNDVIAHYM